MTARLEVGPSAMLTLVQKYNAHVPLVFFNTVLGGGQLGRMMVEAAHRLGAKVVCIDPAGENAPAAQCGAKTYKGHFNNGEDIKAFVKVGALHSQEM